MKEKLQTKFATRQYMISDTFELYYYSTDDVPGVKEHTHTHYEFYLFLEGAISLEIDGVLYTPTPGDLLLIPARFRRVQHDPVPHHPPDRRNAVRSFWKRDADFSLRQRPADADQPHGV